MAEKAETVVTNTFTPVSRGVFSASPKRVVKPSHTKSKRK